MRFSSPCRAAARFAVPIPVGSATTPPPPTRRTLFPLFAGAALPPPPADLAAQLRATFRSGARYLGDAASLRAADAAAPPELRLRRRLERASYAEVAFVGRSNAGKSSLLNALFGDGAGEFVRTSRRPGTTSRVDLFGCGLGPSPRLVLADTPGFGYSAGGRAAHRQWMRDVGEYLQPSPALVAEAGAGAGARFAGGAGARGCGGSSDVGSGGGGGGGSGGGSGGGGGGGGGGGDCAPSTFAAASADDDAADAASSRRLVRVVVLLDARVAAGAGLAPVDLEVLRLLDGAGLPLQAVLTKADLVSALELERAAAAAAAHLARLRTPFPFLLAVSSRSGEGVAALQQTLLMAARLLQR